MPGRRAYFFWIEIWPQEVYFLTGLLILGGLRPVPRDQRSSAGSGAASPARRRSGPTSSCWSSAGSRATAARASASTRRRSTAREGAPQGGQARRLAADRVRDRRRLGHVLQRRADGGPGDPHRRGRRSRSTSSSACSPPRPTCWPAGRASRSAPTCARGRASRAALLDQRQPARHLPRLARRAARAAQEGHRLGGPRRLHRLQPVRRRLPDRASTSATACSSSCIGCGLCIDACNDVMAKVGRPPELIAWDSERNQALRAAGAAAGAPPRPAAHDALRGAPRARRRRHADRRSRLRAALDLNVLHDRNPLFVTLSDGSIRNGYTLKILNKAREPQVYRAVARRRSCRRRYPVVGGGRDGPGPVELRRAPGRASPSLPGLRHRCRGRRSTARRGRHLRSLTDRATGETARTRPSSGDPAMIGPGALRAWRRAQPLDPAGRSLAFFARRAGRQRDHDRARLRHLARPRDRRRLPEGPGLQRALGGRARAGGPGLAGRARLQAGSGEARRGRARAAPRRPLSASLIERRRGARRPRPPDPRGPRLRGRAVGAPRGGVYAPRRRSRSPASGTCGCRPSTAAGRYRRPGGSWSRDRGLAIPARRTGPAPPRGRPCRRPRVLRATDAGRAAPPAPDGRGRALRRLRAPDRGGAARREPAVVEARAQPLHAPPGARLAGPAPRAAASSPAVVDRPRLPRRALRPGPARAPAMPRARSRAAALPWPSPGFAAANVMLLSVSVWAGHAQGMGPATRDLLHWFSALIAMPAIAYAGRPFFALGPGRAAAPAAPTWTCRSRSASSSPPR